MVKNKYSLELWRCDMWVWHMYACMKVKVKEQWEWLGLFLC